MKQENDVSVMFMANHTAYACTHDSSAVARINMVKADKARAVEDLLIRMAQSGQLRSKVSEKQLIDLLGQINQQDAGASQTKIVVSERNQEDTCV